MRMAEIIQIMPELEGEESLFVSGVIKDMPEDQARTFAVAYRSQRRDTTNVLLFTLLGFIMIAGVQRFYLGQIGMGLLYLFTGGFCLIGTIIDLVNHKSLAFKYNQEKAQTIAMMVRGST
jgi:TM2 domain-containing membrane protein YozV